MASAGSLKEGVVREKGVVTVTLLTFSLFSDQSVLYLAETYVE